MVNLSPEQHQRLNEEVRRMVDSRYPKESFGDKFLKILPFITVITVMLAILGTTASISYRIGSIETSIANLQSTVASMDAKMDARFATMDAKMDARAAAADAKFDKQMSVLLNHAERITAIEARPAR
jgi:hypothetical protein